MDKSITSDEELDQALNVALGFNTNDIEETKGYVKGVIKAVFEGYKEGKFNG